MSRIIIKLIIVIVLFLSFVPEMYACDTVSIVLNYYGIVKPKSSSSYPYEAYLLATVTSGYANSWTVYPDSGVSCEIVECYSGGAGTGLCALYIESDTAGDYEVKIRATATSTYDQKTCNLVVNEVGSVLVMPTFATPGTDVTFTPTSSPSCSLGFLQWEGRYSEDGSSWSDYSSIGSSANPLVTSFSIPGFYQALAKNGENDEGKESVAVPVVQLNEVTVDANATNILGTDNWITGKDVNEFVIVEAIISPSIPDENVPDVLTWEGGIEFEDNNLKRKVSKSTSGTTTVTATVGTASDSVNIVVVEVEITSYLGVTGASSGNKFCFDNNIPGVCSFTVTGTTGYPALDTNLQWELEGITGSSLTSSPDPPQGATVTFTYTTLPELNSEFGIKNITLSYSGTEIEVVEEIEIYYPFAAKNWPGAAVDGGAPPEVPRDPFPTYYNYRWEKTNWYYYYSQTTAHVGCIYYFDFSMCSPYDHINNYPALVGNIQNPRPPLSYTDSRSGISIQNNDQQLYGINCFAWASRHEMKHHDDYSSTAWWGTGGVISAQDQDGDRVPDYLESSFSPADGGPFYNYTSTTHSSTGWLDDQSECLFSQDYWELGSLDSQDWAYPGSKWH